MRKRGLYEKYIKRLLDLTCSVFVIVFFSWLYIIIAILVRIKLGSPVLFKQLRPGLTNGDQKVTLFEIYKFRTMTDETDANGVLKPDEERLTSFGRKLRATSLDELPQVFNILRGDMSIIGPRPQLVRDMVFMDRQARMRHTAKPGLSGLAQIHGRNALTWEQKFEWDLKYIEHVSFWNDLKILLLTVRKVVKRAEGDAELSVTDDYGDALLKAGKITNDEYARKQAEAKRILEEWS